MKEARVACHGKRTEQSETAAFLLEAGKEHKTSNAFERAFFLCDTKRNTAGAPNAPERGGLRNCGTNAEPR